MGKNKKILFFLLAIIVTVDASAQSGKYVFKGTVSDAETKLTIPGVNIVFYRKERPVGTITDLDGKYIFEKMPQDIDSVIFSFVGYDTYKTGPIDFSANNVQTMDISLKPSSIEIEGVEIKPYTRKDLPMDKRAFVSARSFTLAETNRYAGSYGDPARMAVNYAGVMPARDNRNDIIIRGNTPTGLQWRIDGMEIPNPNHFGASGTTGGPIIIINTNTLANSDFFTGAFPAEYGNALAGVFDLNMRPGDNAHHRHWVSIGWNGLEAGSEGPINKKNYSSYIIAYRYSFYSLITDLLKINADPHYQDLSFKFNFPKTKIGAISVFGVGGLSHIDLYNSKYNQKTWMFDTHGEDISNHYNMGILGVNHAIKVGENSRLNTHIGITGNGVLNEIDTFSVNSPELFRWGLERAEVVKGIASTNLTGELTEKLEYSTGIKYHHFYCNFTDSQHLKDDYIIYTNSQKEQFGLYQAYGDLSYSINKHLLSYGGIHFQYFDLNNSYAIEPRFGLKLKVEPDHLFSYGFGMHSQIQPEMFYFVRTSLSDGSIAYTNMDLGFTKSIHNIISYDYRFFEDYRIKAEAYLQYLYDIPVAINNPAYASINYGAEYYIKREDSLVNEGTGKNYGLEVTLEKFLSKNYYYLVTGSLYSSKYTGLDDIERNTAFNGRFAINVLGGYEFHAPRKQTTLLLSINLTYAGGKPYVPYDVDETVQQGETIYNWDRAYDVYRPQFKRLSFRIGFRRNKPKYRMESAIDLQYRTGYTNVYIDRIDVTTGKIHNYNKMGFYPMGNLRYEF